jgi:hypothetical protein
MRRKLPLSLLLVTMFVPALAGAQTEPTPTAEATAAPPAGDPLAKENWPLSGVDRPLGLSAGMLQVDFKTLTNMSKELVGKPFAMPLGILYGITNELQAAVLHTTGLCLSGEENGCTKVYNDLSLQILFSLFGRGSSFETATWAQINFSNFDAGTMNLQVGGAFNWVTGGGNVAVLAYPNVGLGLNKRDAGNKEYLAAPVYAYFRAHPQVAPYLATGLGASALDGFGDAWNVPAGVGVLVGINTMIDVGAEFDLLNPFHAPDGVGAADARALYVWLSLRPL